MVKVSIYLFGHMQVITLSYLIKIFKNVSMVATKDLETNLY